MNQGEEKLMVLFKDNFPSLCSPQEALFYIVLGLIPKASNLDFQHIVNQSLKLNYGFEENPFLSNNFEQFESYVNSYLKSKKDIKPFIYSLNLENDSFSDSLESIIGKCYDYDIKLERLCQKPLKKLLKLIKDGQISLYKKDGIRKLTNETVNSVKLNHRYWNDESDIDIDFIKVAELFPLDKLIKPRHYKIVNNGIQLVLLENISEKRGEKFQEKHDNSPSGIAKNNVTRLIYNKLPAEKRSGEHANKILLLLSNLSADLERISPAYVYSKNKKSKIPTTQAQDMEMNMILADFAHRYEIALLHLEIAIKEYYGEFDDRTKKTLQKWCREFKSEKK